MHAHSTEIMPKTWLHKRSCSRIKQLTWRSEHIMYDRWHTISGCRTDCRSLYHSLALLAALGTLFSRNSMLATRTLTLHNSTRGRPCHNILLDLGCCLLIHQPIPPCTACAICCPN